MEPQSRHHFPPYEDPHQRAGGHHRVLAVRVCVADDIWRTIVAFDDSVTAGDLKYHHIGKTEAHHIWNLAVETEETGTMAPRCDLEVKCLIGRHNVARP